MSYTEKYVRTDAAGGGNGTTDANSGANGAYTLAEAITHAASNTAIRYNVKSGTYTLAADLAIPAAATEANNVWQGFQTTIGDLLTVGRATATGDLTVTNFPVIDGSTLYAITSVGSYNQLINLSVTTGKNAAVITMATSCSGVQLYRCKFNSSHATTATTLVTGSSATYSVVDCDIVGASSGAFTGINTGRGTAVGNKVTNTNGSPSATSVGINVSDIGSSAFGNIVNGFGIGITVGSGHLTVHNSIYDCTTGIFLNGTSACVINNVVQDVSGYLFRGAASTGSPLLLNNASTTPTSGRLDTSTMGSEIREISPISLSGNPFTNAGSGDFTLNNTAGAGADCRAASLLFGGEADLGAVQHTDAGGGGAQGSGFFA